MWCHWAAKDSFQISTYVVRQHGGVFVHKPVFLCVRILHLVPSGTCINRFSSPGGESLQDASRRWYSVSKCAIVTAASPSHRAATATDWRDEWKERGMKTQRAVLTKNNGLHLVFPLTADCNTVHVGGHSIRVPSLHQPSHGPAYQLVLQDRFYC